MGTGLFPAERPQTKPFACGEFSTYVKSPLYQAELPTHEREGYEVYAALKAPYLHKESRLILAMTVAALVAFAAYLPVLEYPFTGTDTFTLIETSRITSVEDLAALPAKPLMWGSEFPTHGMFYRPIAALSYGLDHRIWGLDPFGYHLTDVILHTLVVMLVAVLVGMLTNDDYLTAGTAAVLFAVHPILVENVPAPDHRHDVMAAMLSILSLLLFVKGFSQKRWERTCIAVSLFLYVAALGSKAIVIFFPALIFIYCFLFGPVNRLVSRFLRAGWSTFPFVAATIAYLVWRISVLGSLGGYRNHIPTGDLWTEAFAIVILYFQDLLYPQDYPGIFNFLSLSVFIPVLVVCGICALGVWLRLNGAGSPRMYDSDDWRLTAFFSFWIILPLLVCLATMTFSHRSMYIPAIPLCALLSCVFVTSLRRLKERSIETEEKVNRNTPKPPFLRSVVQSVILAGSTVMIGSLLLASPLVREYREWRDSAEMSSLLFQRLSEVLPSLPPHVTIHLHRVPSAISGYEDRLPRARGVGYLNDYSIASWFRLFHPDQKVKVVVHDRFSPESLPRALDLRIEGSDMSNPQVIVEFPGTPGRQVSPAD